MIHSFTRGEWSVGGSTSYRKTGRILEFATSVYYIFTATSGASDVIPCVLHKSYADEDYMIDLTLVADGDAWIWLVETRITIMTTMMRTSPTRWWKKGEGSNVFWFRPESASSSSPTLIWKEKRGYKSFCWSYTPPYMKRSSCYYLLLQKLEQSKSRSSLFSSFRTTRFIHSQVCPSRHPSGSTSLHRR